MKGARKMNTENYPELYAEPSLQRLFQPLSDDDNEILKLISQKPDLKNVQIWNNVLISDYNIYKICIDHSIRCELQKVTFRNIYKAGTYICTEQLKRQDLTPEFQKYLVGQKFLFEEKRSKAGKQKRYNKNNLASAIGSYHHLSYGTVLKYSLYAAAVNYIYDTSDSLAVWILSGKIRVSHENILELSHLRPEELKNVARAITEEKISHLTFVDIRMAVKGKYTHKKAPVSRREREEKKELENRNNATIRQMPVYDPDADVNSLCMTITSWVSSIERVNRSADFTSITTKALYELVRKLTILEETIKAMQKTLVERDEK